MKLTKDQRKEKEIQREMRSCVHFKGIHTNDTCKANVNIRQLVGGPDLGWALRIPCFSSDKCEVICESRLLPTREQAEATIVENDARFERTMKAIEVAHAHATAAGLKRGNGGIGSMPCPIGCGGNLKYSVASSNGHMHAACENGCVSWME